MNNGSRDTSHSDIQKLQQQLQDIKEQVRVSFASRFVMRRFNETNNFVCAERSPCWMPYNYVLLLKDRLLGGRILNLFAVYALTLTITLFNLRVLPFLRKKSAKYKHP